MSGLFWTMQIAMNHENVCLGKYCHWNVSIFTQHPQLSLQQYSFYILGQAATAVWSCGSVTVFILERNTETYFDTWVISDNFKLGAATARTVKVLTRWMLTLLNCWQTMLTLTMLNLYLHLPCMLYCGRGGRNTFTGKVCILNLLGLISWHWHLIYNVWLK